MGAPDRPKVLTPVGGRPIIHRLLEAVRPIVPRPVLVIGHGGEQVIEATGNEHVYAWQKEQLGTGHAVSAARAELEALRADPIIVLPGDHPHISTATIRRLLETHETHRPAVTFTTAVVPAYENDWANYEHYGRILRDASGTVLGIREFKDATPEERAGREVNVGYYCFDAGWLWENIGKISNTNAAGEYYLTDMIGLAVAQGRPLRTVVIEKAIEGMGVNTPEELAVAEKHA